MHLSLIQLTLLIFILSVINHYSFLDIMEVNNNNDGDPESIGPLDLGKKKHLRKSRDIFDIKHRDYERTTYDRNKQQKTYEEMPMDKKELLLEKQRQRMQNIRWKRLSSEREYAQNVVDAALFDFPEQYTPQGSSNEISGGADVDLDVQIGGNANNEIDHDQSNVELDVETCGDVNNDSNEIVGGADVDLDVQMGGNADNEIDHDQSIVELDVETGGDVNNYIDQDEIVDDGILEGSQEYCDNCMRQQMQGVTEESPYFMELHDVLSSSIRRFKCQLRLVLYHGVGTRLFMSYTLCKECKNYLKKLDDPLEEKEAIKHAADWKNTWPSFLWNLLSGKEVSTGRRFHVSYEPVRLWRFIPGSIRQYWMDAIHDIRNEADEEYYYRCTEEFPIPFFNDRTLDVKNFREVVSKREIKSLMGLLKPRGSNKPIILPDVLCPWGCTEFCFEAGHSNLGLLIQHHLRRVELNMPNSKYYRNLYLVETSRQDYIRQSKRDYIQGGDVSLDLESPRNDDIPDEKVLYDNILLKEEWPILPAVELVGGKGLMVMNCRHHRSNNTTKRLYPHPPRKPHHNLSPEKSDQLCPASLQPRLFSPVRACKFNTMFQMSTQQSSFAGVDSMNITTEPRFTRKSAMLGASEALSLAGRQDICHLAAKNVHEGTMLEELKDNLMEESKRLYPKGSLDQYKVGATYVGMEDSVYLQMNSQKSSISAIVKRKRHGTGEGMEEVNVALQRTWSPLNNFLQTEDPQLYGTPMKAVDFYRGVRTSATMMQWAVASAILGCKELHRGIDKKMLPFRFDGWAGHMLAHLNHAYMKHNDIATPKGSPFKSNRSKMFIRKAMERCMPDRMRVFQGSVADDPNLFYRFSDDYWQSLFPPQDYQSISIHSSLDDAVGTGGVDSSITDVVIIVGPVCPNENFSTNAKPGSIVIGNAEFEARVIMCIDAPLSANNNRSTFTGTRFTRHGSGFSSWWKQERRQGAPQMMTNYCMPHDHQQGNFPRLDEGLFSYVTVYVKLSTPSLKKMKLDFHRSLGGQVHVFCSCSSNTFPLIPTAKNKETKGKCMNSDCEGKEAYICSKYLCNTKICSACFKKFSPLTISTVTPATDGDHSSSVMQRNDSSIDVNRENNDDWNSDNVASSETVVSDWDLCNCDYDPDISYGSNTNDELEIDDSTNNASVVVDWDDHVDFQYSGGATCRGWTDSDEEDSNTSYSTEGETSEAEWTMDEQSEEWNDHHDDWHAEEEEDFEEEEEYYEDNEFEEDDDDEFEQEEDDEDVAMYQNVHEDGLRERIFGLRQAMDRNEDEIVDTGNGDRDAFMLDDFLTYSNENPIDDAPDADDAYNADDPMYNAIPKTNAGAFAHTILDRTRNSIVPCHVLFNQAATLLTRYKKRINGTQVQRNFIQRITSTIAGFSIPLLYLMASCFPRHFYAEATHDPCAILGSAPISCYTSATNPHGFASSLSIARNLVTHSSSSTSTCPLFMSFCYDIQANKVAGGMDSRVIARRGFVVDVKSQNGMSVREGENPATLNESVDSHQAALDLAATQPFLMFDWFLTFTCNQAEHPGISHLHQHKESMDWTRSLDGYEKLPIAAKDEVKLSFEMAYGSTLGRCWMEVRKLWLEYITYSTTSVIGKVAHVFFRDEYQEKSANLPHIHGLVALSKEDLKKEGMKELIYDLQKSAVCDLYPSTEIQRYIDEGLFESERDWHTTTAHAKEVLSHKHDQRCQRKIGEGDGPENYRCRKPHSVKGKTKPLQDELIPLHYKFSEACRNILQKTCLWDPPTPEAPNGTIRSNLLQPRRHMGKVHPAATCNMSPVIPEFFAITKSQQNAQILHGSNGVAKYVVKYIVKLDQGNRCVVWADAHSGAVMQAEHQFLHNTKITSSKKNEEKAFEKSRKKFHPVGRAIAFTEEQQQVLGYPEVMTTLEYVRIATKPFEHRKTTKVELDIKGKLKRPDKKKKAPRDSAAGERAADRENAPDAQSGFCLVQKIRRDKNMTRLMSPQQELMFGENFENGAYDKVTEFGLRPVELLQLFPNPGMYFRWFDIGGEMKKEQIESGLSESIVSCSWIDSLGRRVKLRMKALNEVHHHLTDDVIREDCSEDSWELRKHLLDMIECVKSGVCTRSQMTQCKQFVERGKGEHLPIPVFSSVTPHNPTPFLLHMMLMLGKYETELDIRMQPSIRHSLVKVKLIGNETTDEALELYSNQLVEMVVTKVLSVQPISLRRLDDFVIMSKRLFDSVLLRNEIPIFDIPPCTLTEMLNSVDVGLKSFWENKKKDQLSAIYQAMPDSINIPSKEEVMKCSKNEPVEWEPIDQFTKYDGQSDESYREQLRAVQIAVRSIIKYSFEFGPQATVFNKGNIIEGAPGSGKSHIILYLSLFAMSLGLRVMTTALMGVRANALGGIHLHRLFGLMSRKKGNPYRLAELALEKLNRKSQIQYLHAIRTMDVLIIDECGQLSAEQLSILDIILRKARSTDVPFGGVLILGTMDHTQLGAINGWPFLLSSHVLTDFVITQLSHSVRAHGDINLQRIQQLTRMTPTKLLSKRGNEEESYEDEFKRLVKDNMVFASSWEDDVITADIQRMYARRIPAYEASSKYVESCQQKFIANNTQHSVSLSIDEQHIADSRADFVPATSDALISAINHAVREPRKLVFWSGGQYEATMNGEGFNQSQLLLMLEVPTQEMLALKTPIPLMAAPPGVNSIDLSNGIPSYEGLITDKWKPVMVGHSIEQEIPYRGLVGRRQQYALRHIGSSTINKQMGNTIEGKCALEFTKDCCPWDKPQIVVGLSRTRRAQDIVIVGPQEFAVDKMWELITLRNQWTAYIDVLLSTHSVNSNGEDGVNQNMTLPYADVYPYRTCDIILPTDTSGYVYFLVSVRDFDRDYIGQTKNLAQRFNQHNSGQGAEGTADPYYRPYCVAAYICGLSHMEKVGRESLERKWKLFNKDAIRNGRHTIEHRILQGERVVQEYNADCLEEERIQLVVTIKRKMADMQEH